MRKLIFKFGFLSILLLGCTNEEKIEPKNQTEPNIEGETIANYSVLVLKNYQDALQKVKDLEVAIKDFTQAPDQTKFENCQSKWKEARLVYGQTEAFRLYGGPIDGEDGPEGLINGWPMDEAYVDYVVGNSVAGIINLPSTYPTIDKQTLIDANENGSETNLSTGFHAIEFLLWGQDLSATSAGQRPYTDFTTLANADRRKAYLNVCAELLIDHLEQVTDAWEINSTWYNSFNDPNKKKESLKMMVEGIGKLSKGELAGERMRVAVENQDQEDEHSCFSDNTHIDIQMNLKGIKNVYFGKYISSTGQTITGTSLHDMIKAKDRNVASNVENAFIEAENAVNAISTPFDQAIINDSEDILTAVRKLQTLSDQFADMASKLGIPLNTSDE